MADIVTTTVRRIAADAYDAGEGRFPLDAIIDAVASHPDVVAFGPALIRGAAANAVGYVDASRTARPEQCGMFEDLDRVLAFGDGTRRRKADCTLDELRQHLDIVKANARAVAAAAASEVDEYVRLQPFFTDDETTVQQAVLAYRAQIDEAA